MRWSACRRRARSLDPPVGHYSAALGVHEQRKIGLRPVGEDFVLPRRDDAGWSEQGDARAPPALSSAFVCRRFAAATGGWHKGVAADATAAIKPSTALMPTKSLWPSPTQDHVGFVIGEERLAHAAAFMASVLRAAFQFRDQQFVQLIVFRSTRDNALKHVGQIGFRIDLVEFRRGNERRRIWPGFSPSAFLLLQNNQIP